MDVYNNPYNPGAGQQPPELAGRDTELGLFDVELHRGAAGRATRGLVLFGVRGVGKTVLLNAMRSRAMDAGWATAKIEARPGRPLQAPLVRGLQGAVRAISRRARNRSRLDAMTRALGVLAVSAGPDGLRVSVDSERTVRSGDFELDLTEVFTDLALLAADAGTGVALFIDEMQDVPVEDLVALCGACHEMSQTARPLFVVGAGLPTVPAVLASARSYAERLFTYRQIDRIPSEAARQALIAPASRAGVTYTDEALTALTALADGYPFFIQAYGKAAWNAALASPITAEDVAAGRPDADHELAEGFFGPRYERATPAEREYLHTMAKIGDGPMSTAAIGRALRRPNASTSAARDALIRKGLVYSPERGLVAFTVPHFAAFLRQQEPPVRTPGVQRRDHRATSVRAATRA